MLRFDRYDLFPHHICLHYTLDQIFPFQSKIYYPTIDLKKLQFSHEELHYLFSHIALFEGFKYCAAFPENYDISAISDGLCAESLQAFSDWFLPAWSQHLYENEKRGYKGPELITAKPLGKSRPLTIRAPQETLLFGNGGGKDSLVGMKLLDEAGVPYAAYQWARTEYGTLREQQRLISKVTRHTHPVCTEMVSVDDDFTDSTFLNLYYPEIKGDVARGNPCQVGTPEGMFEALPICLAKGYSSLVFADERSASKGNITWENKEVNHQWIKSFEAETLFRNFIKEHLISNFDFYSLLRPLYDWQIFHELTKYPQALPDIHSCNIEKPWCRRCAKCAYVWLNLMAHFPKHLIDPIFKENLFDVQELQPYFRQLMGLEDHNAFECVGETNETLLAFKKCHEKGLQGKAMQLFCTEILSRSINWEQLGKQYSTPDLLQHHIPYKIFVAIAASSERSVLSRKICP